MGMCIGEWLDGWVRSCQITNNEISIDLINSV